MKKAISLIKYLINSMEGNTHYSTSGKHYSQRDIDFLNEKIFLNNLQLFAIENYDDTILLNREGKRVKVCFIGETDGNMAVDCGSNRKYKMKDGKVMMDGFNYVKAYAEILSDGAEGEVTYQINASTSIFDKFNGFVLHGDKNADILASLMYKDGYDDPYIQSNASTRRKDIRHFNSAINMQVYDKIMQQRNACIK